RGPLSTRPVEPAKLERKGTLRSPLGFTHPIADLQVFEVTTPAGESSTPAPGPTVIEVPARWLCERREQARPDGQRIVGRRFQLTGQIDRIDHVPVDAGKSDLGIAGEQIKW